MDFNFAADGDLRELSAEEAWKTIENVARGQKVWDKPFKAISEQELASLRVMRYFSFGRHLDDLHVTWAHLEKKRTRLRTNTKTLEDLYS
ncbi:hypothetical protein Tco_1024508 [Tanacetum coccineum]